MFNQEDRFDNPVKGYRRIEIPVIRECFPDTDLSALIYVGTWITRTNGMPLYRLEWAQGDESTIHFPRGYLKYICSDPNLTKLLSDASKSPDEIALDLQDIGYVDMARLAMMEELSGVNRVVQKLLSGIDTER